MGDRPHPVLAIVRELVPRVAGVADWAEREKRLAPELVAELADAGLFRQLVPRSLGGGELELPVYVEAIEAIARADASTAWCVNQSAVRATTAAWLEPSVARMIFGTDRGAPIANGPMPGQAVAVDGGFRLTGRWNFASGCHHAVWLAAVATVVEANQPRRLADGSIDARHFVIPASQARIEPSWDVAGLRGTGSDTFAVDDLFVPGERAVSVARDPCREDGPLYRYPMTLLFASGFAAVALGVAGSAIDDLIELAGAKRPRGLKGLLRDQALAQLQVGQAEAHRQAGRALLHQAVCDTWQRAVECRQVTVADRARLRLATTHAIRLADQAVDLVYAAAGASAIYAASPLQRRYQDMKVISQHIQGRVAYYESVGRFLLGLDPDPAWANV